MKSMTRSLLYSVHILSSVIHRHFCYYSKLCKFTPSRSTFVWKDKSQGNWFSFSLGQTAFQLSVSNPSKSVSQETGKGFQDIPTPVSEWPSTTWSRLNLHFTSKKGKVHTWGADGRNNSYLKPGFHHFCLSLPAVSESAGLCPPCHTCWPQEQDCLYPGNIFKGEARVERVRYHTQCKFIVHSFVFKWHNATAGRRSSS